MRLGQVARKYDIPVQELIDFLSEETGEQFHPNSKLFDGIESRIFEAFDLEPQAEKTQERKIDESVNETEKESIDAPIEQSSVPETPNIPQAKVETPEDDIALAEGELAFHSSDEVERQPIQNEEPEKLEPQEDEIILSDQLIEMMESDEAPADLDKVKLIKAPKKELPGLKVLGKVDLPEAKPKSTDKDKDDRSTRNRKPQLSEEEKEKRRLKAKRKKEAYEAKREKQRKEQEAQRLKNLKQKHYQQRVQKPQEVKKKTAKVETLPTNQKSSVRKKTKPQPKTLLGKWWRWMNT